MKILFPDLSPLLYGFVNFFVYLTPLYLFFVRVWAEKLRFKSTLDMITNKLLVTIASVLIFIFVALNYIWTPEQPIFQWIGSIYLVTFIIYLWILPSWMGSFDSFVIAVSCVFVLAEVWELPIIINNIMINDFTFAWQNLLLTSLKLVSIPALIFYTRDYQDLPYETETVHGVIGWWRPRGLDVMLIVTLLTLGFFSFWEGMSLITYHMGIYIRTIVAFTLLIYLLGFRKVKT